MFEDTYFFDAGQALRVAKEQNKPSRYVLQLCYYNGEKIDHEGLENLVHLPVENFVNGLALGVYRIPTKVDFSGLEVSKEVQGEILEGLKASIAQAKAMRDELNRHYFESLKNAKLDFSQKLRFYIPASSNTRVMQHISKNIADTLVEMGYEVYFNLNVGVKDLNCLKEIKEFNPHATININHINNVMLSEEVFNFVWIQDKFAIEQFKKFPLRERDIVFHLIEHLNKPLQALDVASEYQPFCINTNIYKPRKEIEKEKKIVFIGSSYKNNFDTIRHEQKHQAAKDILQDYIQNGYIRMERRAEYLARYKYLSGDELGAVFNYVERDLLIKEIIKLDLEYKFELYGYEWELDEELKEYSKGILNYGENISKVYNSARYGLVIGGYILQQRTLESAASGAIPLVFDSRQSGADVESECFDKSMTFFKTPADLVEMLKTAQNKDLECIVNEHSYRNFAEHMITKIKSAL